MGRASWDISQESCAASFCLVQMLKRRIVLTLDLRRASCIISTKDHVLTTFSPPSILQDKYTCTFTYASQGGTNEVSCSKFHVVLYGRIHCHGEMPSKKQWDRVIP